MIDHLSAASIQHWDRNVRELASQALAKFTMLDPEYIILDTLPKLVCVCSLSKLIVQMSGIKHRDLIIRHGCVLGVGEVCLALSKQKTMPEIEQLMGQSGLLTLLSDFLQDYPSEFLDGFGSDLHRMAICRYIECLSLASWPANQDVQSCWLAFLESCLLKKDESLQLSAASAIGRFSEAFGLSDAAIDKFMELAGSTKHGDLSRRGYSLVIGELSLDILIARSSELVSSLSLASKVYVCIDLILKANTERIMLPWMMQKRGATLFRL